MSLVAFVRGSPPGPPVVSSRGEPLAPIFRAIRGDWPISGIARRAEGAIEVHLLDEYPSEKSGQMARLRAHEGGWTIERLYVWNAD